MAGLFAVVAASYGLIRIELGRDITAAWRDYRMRAAPSQPTTIEIAAIAPVAATPRRRLPVPPVAPVAALARFTHLAPSAGMCPVGLLHMRERRADLGSPIGLLNNAGYAALRAGRDWDAAAAFRQSLAIDPDQSLIQRQVGYLHRAAGEDTAARAAFAHALALGGLDPATRLGLTREVADIDHRFDLSAYAVWRSRALGDLNLAAIGPSLGQSQSALEAAFRPDLAPAANRHRLTVAGRLIWGYEGDSLHIDGDSTQAGIAIRGRPFPALDLTVGAERLIAIGDKARSDWLLRAAWSAGRGFAPPATHESWNYWSVYVDGAVIDPADPDLFLTGDARIGRGWAVGGDGRWMLTPFVGASAAVQDAGATTSLVEAGPGLWLRFRADTTVFDLRADYRARIAGDSAAGGGFTLTLALSF